MTQREMLLIQLIQECGEVAKAATKALLHGDAPCFQGVQYDNIADIESEYIDVRATVALLGKTGVIHFDSTVDLTERMNKIMKMLGYPLL
jgi:NADH:ubiquinone oxidoreductase subunit F (NADH-binding)